MGQGVADLLGARIGCLDGFEPLGETDRGLLDTLLTVLPEVLRSVEQYRMVMYSVLLIVLMLVRPKGLFNFDYAAISSRLWA